jgi:hypothetical protein
MAVKHIKTKRLYSEHWHMLRFLVSKGVAKWTDVDSVASWLNWASGRIFCAVSDPNKTRWPHVNVTCANARCTIFLFLYVLRPYESKNPEQIYRLISPNNTAWINVRKIPRGLYRVKYKTIDNQVVVKLKRYNSKYKRLALIVKVETFTGTPFIGPKKI